MRNNITLRLGKKKEKGTFSFCIGKEYINYPRMHQNAHMLKMFENFRYLHEKRFNYLPFCLTCQVFQCEVDDCGHFYHTKCVAKLLYPDSEDKATLFEVQVAVARENFTCPMHECIVCKGGENKNDRNMQFAVCRRCPTTYHRMCLPRYSFFLEMPMLPFLLCSTVKPGFSFLDSL
jgi:hypothetical protein